MPVTAKMMKRHTAMQAAKSCQGVIGDEGRAE